MALETDCATPEPTVLLVSDDLFAIPRLQVPARAARLSPVVVDAPQVLDAEGEPAPRRVPITGLLEGGDARFLRAVVNRQPALIIFDLSSTTLPWVRWIQILSTSSATRRIPLAAFAPHVEVHRLQRALDLGVVKALRRGSFLAALPGILAAACPPAGPGGDRGGMPG